MDEIGEHFFMNGSCDGPSYEEERQGSIRIRRRCSRSRSPPPQPQPSCPHNNVVARLHPSAAALAATGATGYIPQWAKHAVCNLPCFIKCRFPWDDAENLSLNDRWLHCKTCIERVRSWDPGQWYLGITQSPLFRWNLSHYKDYVGMHLMVVSRTSVETRSLEEQFITHYLAAHDISFMNVDANASGSLWGSPSFFYICYSERGPLRRRPSRKQYSCSV